MNRNLLLSAKHWFVYLTVAVLSILSVDAQNYILNNGYLRMGNGSENSINAFGNVQQPFYFDNVSNTWRKLTFSNYPLDIAVATGGDKTNNWNINGSVVVNPALTGQVIDYSGYIATTGTTGWGVIKSTGTITIGGKLLRVEQTYTLPQSSGYIGIKVKVTNIDATLTENVRIWVGTRDDWVGASDVPRKQRGNIVNGAFVQNTTTAQQALALKISSGAEAVLVYTNSNRGQTSVSSCCSFNNAMNTNPATSTFDVTNDGSYAFYMRLNDLAPNASDEFTWYYAAGSLANIDNIINEVAQASGSVQNITCNTATYNATATANGTGYWMVVPQGSTAPTAAQIKAGTNYGSVTVAASGNGAMTANTQRSFNISGLNASTNYTIYFVHEDAVPQFSAILNSNFSTINNTAAITASGSTSFCPGGSVTLTANTGAGLSYQWNNASGPIAGATSSTYVATTSGTFNVTILRTGCSNATSNSISTTLNFLPSVTASSNSPVIVGQSLNLSASGASTYSWSGPNGFISNLQSPSITNAQTSNSGTYTVTGTSSAGCVASSTVNVSVTCASPTITNCPQTQYQQIYADSNLCSAIFSYNPTITGTGAVASYTFSGATTGSGAGTGSGSRFNVGQTTVTINVTGTCGTASCSFVVTVVDNVAPKAISKNATVYLNASGTASVTPAQIDNGSNDNCGAVTLSMSQTGTICGFATEGQNVVLTAPAGAVITSIDFASYGTPTGSCGSYAQGWCHAANSKSIVEGYALNHNTATIPAVNGVFGDPCGGTVKRLYIQATWTGTGSSTSFNCAKVGANAVNLIVTDANGNVSNAPATVTVLDTIKPTAVSQNVTVSLGTTGTASLTAAQVNNGSTDNCSISTVSLDKTNFSCADLTFNTVSQVFPTNTTWSQSTTVTNYGLPCGQPFLGVSSLPAASTFTITPSLNGYVTNIIPGTQALFAENDIRYFKKSFNINSLNDISAEFLASVDNTVQIWINGVAVALEKDFDGANFGDNIYHRLILGSNGVNTNGGSGYQSFDVVNNVSASSLFVVGNNEIVLAIGNCSGTDRGNISFKATISNKASASVPVILTVTDPSNNSSTSTAFATVVDNIAPVITCPANISVFATSAAGATVNYNLPTATDNCSATVSLVSGLASGSTFPLGTSTVTYRAKDQSGNAVTCSFTVTVTGVAPVIVSPGNITVNNTTNACNANVNYTATETTGIPASTITYSIAPGSNFNVGTAQVTATATNPVGTSSVTFNVTVVDNQNPNAVSQNVTINLDANGAASTTASAVNNGSSDNCGIASVTLSKTSFDCSNVGDNTVTLTVTDIHGNVSTANATVTVVDAIAPTVITKNHTVNLDANGVASITANDVNNGSTDNCGIASVTVSPSTFNCSNVGSSALPVTPYGWWKAENNFQDQTSNGNNGSGVLSPSFAAGNCGQGFVFNGVGSHVDVGNNTNFNGTSAMTIAAWIKPGSNGDEDQIVSKSTHGVPSSWEFRKYGQTLQYTYKATNGVQYAVSANVLVANTWQHVAATWDGTTMKLYHNGSLVGTSTGAPMAPNNFSMKIGENQGYGDSHGAYQGNIDEVMYFTSALTASQVSSIMPCGGSTANAVTVTVTDVNGNISTGTAQVTVKDLIPPTAVAQNVTINLDANGAASTTASAVNNGSSDNCGIASIALSKTSFDCSNVGSNNVTLTVTDVNGNVSTASAVVTVVDAIAPTAVAQNVTINLDANGAASTTASAVNNGSSDNCGIASLALSKTAFDCSNVGSNPVTLTVTDVNGNVSTANATVTVVDAINPTAVAQNVTIYLNASGAASTTASAVNNGSSDNCRIATVVLSKTAFDCSNVGANTVTLTVTDVNGNVSTANATVTVVDAINPTVVAQNVTIYLNASGAASTSASAVNNGSSDNCGIATVVLSKTAFDCSNVGANTVTLTVTDVNGNVSSTNATVTVVDAILPTVIAQNLSLTLANGIVNITAAQVNNGSYDNCAIASMTVSPSSFNCGNIGNNTVTLTVTDVNGNVNSTTATVTINGVVPSCSITSAPRNNGPVIGTTTTYAAVNQMFLGYGPQTMNINCTAVGAGPFTYSWSGVGLSNYSISNPVFAPTTAGNFTLTCTITNIYGCQSTCNITICVINAVAPGGSANNPKVLLCHYPPGNPNNPQTLSIGVSAVPAHLGQHGGDKLGSCNAVCGMAKTSADGEMYTEETIYGEINLVVYPNPSNSSFNFRVESPNKDVVNLKLYDMSGRVVLSLENQNPENVITVSQDMAPGVYLATVTQGDYVKTVKITKVN